MGKTIKYFKVNKLTDKDFRRVVGVKRDTFKDMIKVVRRHWTSPKSS